MGCWSICSGAHAEVLRKPPGFNLSGFRFFPVGAQRESAMVPFFVSIPRGLLISMKDPKNWYKEPTFRFCMWAINIGGIAFTIALSLYDQMFRWEGLLFNAFAWLIVVPITYLMRNNP